MNCDEVDELVGAYALDALPGDVWANVRAHLDTCSNHPEAAELRAVAAALAFAAPEAQPPAALRTRLMAALREEPKLVPQSPPGPGLMSRLNRLAARPAVAYALAGALAVALIALVITNVGGGSEQPQTGRATVSLSGANNASAVVYELEDGVIVVDADGLKPLDDAHTYQLWSLASGKPASLGLMGSAPNGDALAVVRVNVQDIDALAVTVEPAGGSIAPTTNPVLKGDV